MKVNIHDLIKTRFEKNIKWYPTITWAMLEEKIDHRQKIWDSLEAMEATGGEPCFVGEDKRTGDFLFFDCSAESPAGRRSLCFDREAWDSRKANKPEGSAMELASKLGIEMLSVEQYHFLQTLGVFDAKTSSWVTTPKDVRKLGGALFGDYRFGRVFIYHNGAESYYAARGFRGCLRV